MNRSKRKGTVWESRVVEHLRGSGWPNAERRAQTGAADQGDIAGVLGVVVEAKAHATWHPSAWLRELDAEVVNAGADVGVVWAKVAGKSAAQDGVILMRPGQFLALLRAAGY